MKEMQTPDKQDTMIESAVMGHLLDLHPAQLSMEDLLREITGDEGGFDERDAVERAARNLAEVGLAHREGETIVASRAAVRLDELSC